MANNELRPRPSPGAQAIPMSSTPPSHVAEVIEANSIQFVAQCRVLYEAPDLGAFVRVEALAHQPEAFAVVAHIATGVIDPNRRPQALDIPIAELTQRMPHLPMILRTTITGLHVGYRRGNNPPRVSLPPQPPRIHAFVHRASDDEIRELTRDESFLRPLAQAAGVPVEEVIAAALWHADLAWRGQRDHGSRRQAWGRYLGRLFRRDFDRYQAILQRWLGATPPAPEDATPPTTGPASWEWPLPVVGAETLGDDDDPFQRP